jgi:hypothetical protein
VILFFQTPECHRESRSAENNFPLSNQEILQGERSARRSKSTRKVFRVELNKARQDETRQGMASKTRQGEERQAYLDAVPTAVIQAWNIFFIKMNGFFRTAITYKPGRMTNACMTKPVITVIIYQPSMIAKLPISSIAMIFPAIKLRIPIGEYLKNKRLASA